VFQERRGYSRNEHFEHNEEGELISGVKYNEVDRILISRSDINVFKDQ
jgi:hypothetical protein